MATVRVIWKKPRRIKQAAFNAMVREALRAAAKEWVGAFALRHFEAGAAQRYRYQARQERYRRRRAGLARSRGETPADLVWSGEARRRARERAANPDGVRIVARATARMQRVRVPIPIGHPIRAEHAGDYGRLTQEEFRAMRRRAREHLRRLMAEAERERETHEIKGD